MLRTWTPGVRLAPVVVTQHCWWRCVNSWNGGVVDLAHC